MAAEDFHTELALADQARSQGWTREVERHESVARRICQLLTDLGEPAAVNDPPTGTGDSE